VERRLWATVSFVSKNIECCLYRNEEIGAFSGKLGCQRINPRLQSSDDPPKKTQLKVVLDHIYITVNNIATSISFYEQAFAPLGIRHSSFVMLLTMTVLTRVARTSALLPRTWQRSMLFYVTVMAAVPQTTLHPALACMTTRATMQGTS
jgi:hypothetical protein